MAANVSPSSNNADNPICLVAASNGRKLYRVRGSCFEVDERYSLCDICGAGAYGTVCSAKDAVTRRLVAIKKVARVFDDMIDGRRIWREVVVLRLLSRMHCRNALRLDRLLRPRESIHKFRDLYIVTDLAQTCLFSLIKAKRTPTLEQFRRVAVQILRCVADMHDGGIIHRDIKPSNVLLTELGTPTPRSSTPKSAQPVDPLYDVHMCDFGLARGGMQHYETPQRFTDYVVTRWYRPPEILLMSSYHFPADIWSAGCVIAEFLLQRPLFPGKDYLNQLSLIVASVPPQSTAFIADEPTTTFLAEFTSRHRYTRPLATLLRNVPEDIRDLLLKMLVFDPSVRITAKEALRHRAFESVGGDNRSTYEGPISGLDWSFDCDTGYSEARLRGAIWREIELTNAN